MNVCKYGLFVMAALLLLHGAGLPITDLPDDSFRNSLGRELMTALNVPEGVESRFFSGWSYPTSIVVKTIPYRVEVAWRESGCKVYSTNDVTHPLAEAFVTRMSNEKNARLYGFGCLAFGCSLPMESFVRRLSVGNLDPATNALFVSWRSCNPDNENMLISRNLILGIRSGTNALDFAVAIINAGLPEGERIAVSTEGQ